MRLPSAYIWGFYAQAPSSISEIDGALIHGGVLLYQTTISSPASSGVAVIVAAAGFAYFMCNSTTQGRSKDSAKHGALMSWATLPRSVRRQQSGGFSTRRLPSQSSCERISPACPPASKIATVPESIQQLEWSAETPTCEIRNKIQLAISEMQNALQDELQEDELKIHGMLGQGAFGTVYHGMYSPVACSRCAVSLFSQTVSGVPHFHFSGLAYEMDMHPLISIFVR